MVTEVQDEKVVNHAAAPEEWHGITGYVDAGNKSYVEPDAGVFSIFLSANNQLMMKEGEQGMWVEKEDIGGIQFTTNKANTGSIQEMVIPWFLLGGQTELDTRIGFNIRLTENTGNTGFAYRENISFNRDNQPFSWMSLTLE